MRLEADTLIDFPRELVFSTYRDRLPELVPHLPNVVSITVTQREDEVGGVAGISKLTNVWEGKGDIPKVATAIIRPDMVGWTDYATWNEAEWTVDWRTKTRMFTDQIKCEGHNTYEAVGDKTLLKIRGVLEVNLKGVRDVPRLLAGRVAPLVEKFIISLLKPNLVSVADGLNAFLRIEAKR